MVMSLPLNSEIQLETGGITKIVTIEFLNYSNPWKNIYSKEIETSYPYQDIITSLSTIC